MPPKASPLILTLGHAGVAASVLNAWRTNGPRAARQNLDAALRVDPSLENDQLHKELRLRLARSPGPRLLVDGLQ